MIKPTFRTMGCVLTMLSVAGANAQGIDERRNWFNDPFFRMTDQVAACPVPAGPLMTQAEQRSEAHYRAERGTSCWLAGRCARSSAYAYDQDIAAALQAKPRPRRAFNRTNLWVSVQRRIVFVEGCITDPRQVPALQSWARKAPDVEQVVVNVFVPPGHPAYKLRNLP